MPLRSTVFGLDATIRDELDRRIIDAGFGGYAKHVAWLESQGHAISEAALQRYGRRLKRDMGQHGAGGRESAVVAAIARVRHTAELARAVQAAGTGDPLAIHEQTAEMCMTRLYEIAAAEDMDAKTLQAISRSLNDTVRAVVAVRAERADERRQAIEEASERVTGEMKRRGIGKDTAAAIREALREPSGSPAS